MHRSSALAIAAALPVLALGFHVFTLWLPPILGYAAGLALYWCVLAVLVLRRVRERPLAGLVRPRWPGRWPFLVLVLVLGGLVYEAATALTAAPPSTGFLAGAIVAALLNGTVEEVFWRGTLLADPSPGWPVLAASLVLFVFWHVALLFANGVVVTGDAMGVLSGEMALGALFLWLRITSGSVGTAALAHIAVNALAFSALVTAHPVRTAVVRRLCHIQKMLWLWPTCASHVRKRCRGGNRCDGSEGARA